MGTAGVAVAVVALLALLPRGTPPGIVGLGFVNGSINAMLAIGIVLVYRSHRIVNFAHGALGALAGGLTAELVISGWNYGVAVAAGLVAGVALGVLIEVLIIRRFRETARLLVTVATIGLAQLLGALGLLLPRAFGREVREVVGDSTIITPLSRFRFELSPVIFSANEIAAVGALALIVAGLVAFLRRTSMGLALRASAENAERAALCALPVKTVSMVAWAIAGGLAAFTYVLAVPVSGYQPGQAIGAGLLLRALAAAVLGRMSSIPITCAAALVLGIFEQATLWSLHRSTAVDGMLLAIILVGLLVQRRSLARVDDVSSWQAVAPVRPVPAVLRRRWEVRAGTVAVHALLATVVVVVPALLPASRQSLLAVIVIYAIIALSLVVLTGWSGQVSLGQFALTGIGAAVAGVLTTDLHVDFLLATAAAGAAGTAVALLLGLPALRIRGLFLAVTTLAFAVTTWTYLLNPQYVSLLAPNGPVRRPLLLGRIDLEGELAYYYLCVTVLVAGVVVVRRLRRSRVGRAILAVRDNDRAAAAYGVPATAAKLTAFAVSGCLAGLAGALFAHQQHLVSPVQFAPINSLQVFSMAVIGGLGSIPGAILGAVYVKGADYFLSGPWRLLASGAGLMALLLLYPRGLGAAVYAVRDAVLRRFALARRIVVPTLVADERISPARGEPTPVAEVAS